MSFKSLSLIVIVCFNVNAHNVEPERSSDFFGSEKCHKEQASTPHCGKTPTSVLDKEGIFWTRRTITLRD